MQIGAAARRSGISAKMIRHYEAIGLLPKPGRRQSGYRTYAEADVQRLQFIRRARDLGFSIERIRLLLRLWSDHHRSNAEVKALALRHLAEIEEKVRHLREMSDALSRLADACDGDGRPDCPIIDGLEGGTGLTGRHAHPVEPAAAEAHVRAAGPAGSPGQSAPRPANAPGRRESPHAGVIEPPASAAAR